jgi:hypothetical protein
LDSFWALPPDFSAALQTLSIDPTATRLGRRITQRSRRLHGDLDALPPAMMQTVLINQPGLGATSNCAYKGAHNMQPPSDCGKCCCPLCEIYRYDGCDCSMCGVYCSGVAGGIAGFVCGGFLGGPLLMGPCMNLGACAGQMSFMCESRASSPAAFAPRSI